MICTKKGIERIACTMKSFEYVSLIAVALLVLETVRLFNLNGSYAKGPLNPYAFFTDETRLALETASEKALKGELSEADAKELTEKYNVRHCIVFKDKRVLWQIPFCPICNYVAYVYSPAQPYDPLFHTDSLGHGWYWWRWR